jgi:hypothetical protein
MIKLKSILIENTQLKSKIEEYFYECMKKHFSEYYKYIREWGVPKFELMSNPRYAGLFVYLARPRQLDLINQSIKINRDITTNVDNFRSVVFHETIHYVQYNLKVRGLYPYELPFRDTGDGHDAEFFSWVKSINRVEGSNFVKRSEELDVNLKSYKPFYIYGVVDQKDNGLYYYWTVRFNEKAASTLAVLVERGWKSPFILKVDVARLKSANVRFNKSRISLGRIDDDAEKSYVLSLIKKGEDLYSAKKYKTNDKLVG